MANQYRITPEQMRAMANEYRNQADAVNLVTNNLDRLLMDLSDELADTASNSYAARYAELRPSFEKANKLMCEIAETLQKAASSCETVDTCLQFPSKNGLRFEKEKPAPKEEPEKEDKK